MSYSSEAKFTYQIDLVNQVESTDVQPRKLDEQNVQAHGHHIYLYIEYIEIVRERERERELVDPHKTMPS